VSLRKEQVLALVALLLVGYCSRGYFGEPGWSTRFSPQIAEYATATVPTTPLVTGEPPALLRRDFFTEPSETRPLPPRELAFPPRPPLTLAALPLDPGPDYRRAWLLAMDGAQVEGVTLQQAVLQDTEGPTETGPASGLPQGTRAEREERAARIYDRIYINGQRAPFFGTIENDNLDLFALEESGQLDGVELRLRRFNLENWRVESVQVFGGSKDRIDRIVLAGTLRNEVARRLRRVPELPSHLRERVELVDWLLEQAQKEAWVFDEAQRQAEIYLRLASGDVDGLQLMQRVLQAKGDLAGELALLEGIEGNGRHAAFRYQGLGQLKARLGLWVEAEADLREATRLQPTDARPHAALAEFLRQRGRTREAVAAAVRAEQAIGSVQDRTARARIARTIVACRLAAGELDGARDALAHLPRDVEQPYLVGCIQYAAGDVSAALSSFRQAGGGADGGAALLGQAACHLRLSAHQEAYDLFQQVADQEPLLRHRAATGLALLYLRLSQFDAALGHVDRALEAAPDDPYALYLRGRTLRLMGQSSGAADALAAALRERDDFVHAIVEMAAVQADLAAATSGKDQAVALVASRRYADRAVDLAPRVARELYELQGLRAFFAADPRAALAAFARARDVAANEQDAAFAKGASAVVDYSRGLVDDAMVSLNRLEQDLGREHALAKWAGATMTAIEEHARKEALGDGFDRTDVGSIWAADNDGPLAPQMVDGRLTFRGRFSRTGKGEVSVERTGAVKKGMNFLAVGVTVQHGREQPIADSFCGLGIELQSGRGSADLSVRVGIRDGKPFLRIEDGREGGRDDVKQVWLPAEGFDPALPHDLELRAVPRGDENSRQLSLQVGLDGVVVHTHDLKQLTAGTSTELKTILFASGNKGGAVDVAFDDYRLERKRER
jgi:tetratricopeptide (TPR) repeat protein